MEVTNANALNLQLYLNKLFPFSSFSLFLFLFLVFSFWYNIYFLFVYSYREEKLPLHLEVAAQNANSKQFTHSIILFFVLIFALQNKIIISIMVAKSLSNHYRSNLIAQSFVKTKKKKLAQSYVNTTMKFWQKLCWRIASSSDIPWAQMLIRKHLNSIQSW